MIPTWFLSMWISNSATAAMMVTICLAVISQLEESEKQLSNIPTQADENEETMKLNSGDLEMAEPDGNRGYTMTAAGEESEKVSLHTRDRDTSSEDGLVVEGKWVQRGKGLLMSVAYSASIGGIATITGGAPNLIFGEQLARCVPSSYCIVDYCLIAYL